LQHHDDVSDNVPTELFGESVYGETSYREIILNKIFQVSAGAFLQVNTHQCEKLYQGIAKYAEVDEETVFLDICSGTGSIGISMADFSKKIVAIEMVEQACKDAEVNVALNNIKNFEGHCAKVENVIDEIAKNYAGKNKIVGVVDPPRAGILYFTNPFANSLYRH
jgi:tRNA/tmRNA/rRNA uracil-C5-methylase (TrmA/RlmC/RlmD family)